MARKKRNYNFKIVIYAPGGDGGFASYQRGNKFRDKQKA